MYNEYIAVIELDYSNILKEFIYLTYLVYQNNYIVTRHYRNSIKITDYMNIMKSMQ